MGKEVSQPVIVPNLNFNEVTWASSYCLAARECGLNVNPHPTPPESERIFIGDIIPPSLLVNCEVAAYFLAAVEGLSVEKDNIAKTQLSLLPSTAELAKALNVFPDIDAAKLYVAGFPINVNRLLTHYLPWDQKIPRSVCFLGEIKPVKNPRLEMEIIRKLRSFDYRCFHLSPKGVSIYEELNALGCTVIEGIRGDAYLHLASQFQYVVNTSFSESLYISGIEASVMGAVPVLPLQPHSGFNDWCPESLLYDYPSADAAVEIIQSVDGLLRPPIDYRQYHQSRYFDQVKERLSLCR